jgi:hypothetical protein
MRFRGLQTERHDVGPGRKGMRREAVVQTFFTRELSSGARGDAALFWSLMAYAHSDDQMARPDVGTRSAVAVKHLQLSVS